MEDNQVTAEILNSLAEKVAGLDLSKGEQAVLDTVLARAAACETDVEGYVWTDMRPLSTKLSVGSKVWAKGIIGTTYGGDG